MTVLEAGGVVVRQIDLYLAGDSIAVSVQPSVKFIIGLRAFGGRWHDSQFNVGIHVYALHDDGF